MTQCTIAKKRVSVYPSAAPDKPVLYLHTYADEGDAAYRAMQQAGCPNFSAYIQAHGMQNHPSHVYFSLGSKESKARNRYLRTVRQNTEAVEAFYRSQGVDTALAIHPGGHNQDVPARIAAGLAWLLQR